MLLATAAIIGALAQIAWLARSPVEATRVRNALIAVPGSIIEAEWPSEKPMDGFKVEIRPPPQVFVKAAIDAGSANPGVSGIDAAVRIGRHLLSGARWEGGAIKQPSPRAYRQILEDGRGYCADFTQVFTAIAHASDLPVREWGMSFGGFNGQGHAFNEIYDPLLQQWVFIDTHKSFYSLMATIYHERPEH